MKVFLIMILFFPTVSFNARDTKGPFFWQAKKDDKHIYILGTLHFGVALEDLQCSEEISNYLDNSDLVFTEADPNSNTNSEAQLAVQNEIEGLMMDYTGNSYRNFNKKSQQFFQKLNLQHYNVSHYGFLNVLYHICTQDQELHLLQKFNQQGTLSLDKQIKDIAQYKQVNQNILDNDSIKPSLEIFKSIAQNITAQTVEEFINDYHIICSHENMEKLLYLSVDFLDKFKAGENLSFNTIENMKQNRGIHKDTPRPGTFLSNINSILKDFLKERNETWANKLTSASVNNIFVAAGVFHFIEEFNVLDMLKTAGFSVKRMNATCEIKQ